MFFSEELNDLTNDVELSDQNFECKKEIRKEIWTPPPITGYNGSIDVGVVYKFQDPETYKGPVVQGWEPGELG